MSFVLRKKSTQQPSPGLHQARFWDFRDLGMQDWGFGSKHMLALDFCLDEQDAEGNFIVSTLHCQASLHPKSNLHGIVQALLGGTVPAEVDLDALKGQLIQVITKERTAKDGQVYCNIVSAMPIAQPKPALTPPPSAPAPAVTPLPTPPSGPPPGARVSF